MQRESVQPSARPAAAAAEVAAAAAAAAPAAALTRVGRVPLDWGDRVALEHVRLCSRRRASKRTRRVWGGAAGWRSRHEGSRQSMREAGPAQHSMSAPLNRRRASWKGNSSGIVYLLLSSASSTCSKEGKQPAARELSQAPSPAAAASCGARRQSRPPGSTEGVTHTPNDSTRLLDAPVLLDEVERARGPDAADLRHVVASAQDAHVGELLGREAQLGERLLGWVGGVRESERGGVSRPLPLPQPQNRSKQRENKRSEALCKRSTTAPPPKTPLAFW